MTKKSNDEKFIMNFFQKGNNNKQIVNVQNLTQNFTESEYIPDDEEGPEELTEIEKELDKSKKRLISEKIGKKLKAKGYSAKQVGAFTFYIKTRAEYTAALRQTLEFAENMVKAAVRNRDDGDFVQFLIITVLYLSDYLATIEAEEQEQEAEEPNDGDKDNAES